MNRKVILPIFFMTALFVLSCSTSKKTNTATGKSIDIKPICTTSSKEPCWIELENRKGCYLYNGAPAPNETVTWSEDCKNKKTDGKGEEVWYDNGKKVAFYVGYVHQGVKEGEGEYHNPKGDIYKGNYENGVRGGYGEFSFDNGSFYKGLWKNDKINGQGTISFKNGMVFQGIWSNEKLNGQAKIVDSKAGTTYIGEMKDSLKHGKGKLIFTDGRVWLVNYKNDKFYGEVIMINKDGRRTKAVWKDGKLVSPKNK